MRRTGHGSGALYGAGMFVGKNNIEGKSALDANGIDAQQAFGGDIPDNRNLRPNRRRLSHATITVIIPTQFRQQVELLKNQD